MLDIANDKRIYSTNRDYTFPLIALLKGKNLTDLLRIHLGESTHIEDLTMRFFCVSVNATQSKVHVHDTGLLANAVRASPALPAIYPPFYDVEGNMLVDGGILNNMPVDIMRKLIGGGKILAVNSNKGGYEFIRGQFTNEPWKSGWKMLYQKLNPFKNKLEHYDTIFQILRTSLSLSADNYQQLMSKQADFLIEVDTNKYDLFGFDDRHSIIQLGYEAGKEKLRGFTELHKYAYRTPNGR